jgi:DNA-binding NarL/FixJ family response regulator
MDVVSTAETGDVALALIEQEQPTLALLDIHMPGLSGIDVARKVHSSSPATKVLLYTAHVSRAFLADALDAGVLGFVGKDAPLPELTRAIEMVLRGEVYVDPVLAGSFAAERLAPEKPLLTEREREVLRCVAAGYDHEETGRHLYLAPTTVRSHLRKAMAKLGATNRPQAVAEAIRAGYIM